MKFKRIHGHTLNGRTKEYRSWEAAKRRCFNKKDKKYPLYGGRGITMSEKWKNNFVNFLEDMGPCPEKFTIDRIDNNGDYSKENCRWASQKTQQSNRRDNALFTFNGETLTASEWGRKLNLSYRTIIIRAKKGLPIEKILCPIKYKEHRGPRS